MVQFNARENFVFDVTLAVTYNRDMVCTTLPKETAILVYEQARKLANHRGLVTREYKTLVSTTDGTGRIATLFIF